MSVLILYVANEFREFLSNTYSPIIVSAYRKPYSDPGSPIRLAIPSLNINAPIIPVGIDANGLMEVPKVPEEIAWYEPGNTPGNNGNAVLAGHYDSSDGPAVFYRLGELQSGDAIIVTDAKNQTWQFIVADTASYPADNFPTEKVFADSSHPQLNLVTCDGVFDPNTNSYPNRIVIYATMENVRLVGTDKISSDKSW